MRQKQLIDTFAGMKVGMWRVCYIPIASNVSRETGVAVEVEQPEIAIASGSVAP